MQPSNVIVQLPSNIYITNMNEVIIGVDVWIVCLCALRVKCKYDNKHILLDKLK